MVEVLTAQQKKQHISLLLFSDFSSSFEVWLVAAGKQSSSPNLKCGGWLTCFLSFNFLQFQMSGLNWNVVSNCYQASAKTDLVFLNTFFFLSVYKLIYSQL